MILAIELAQRSVIQNDNKFKECACCGCKETIFSTPYSSNGRLLASVSQDSTVRMWDARTNKQMHVMNGIT